MEYLSVSHCQFYLGTWVELWPMSKNSAFFGGAESSGNSKHLGKPQHSATAAVSFIIRRTFNEAILAASSTERRWVDSKSSVSNIYFSKVRHIYLCICEVAGYRDHTFWWWRLVVCLCCCPVRGSSKSFTMLSINISPIPKVIEEHRQELFRSKLPHLTIATIL